MSTNDLPTDPDAKTIGLPSDETGKGSIPEPGKYASKDTPTEIGRYRILGVIGSGGMGAVYEAMQEAPRRRVALKVIKTGAASDMGLRRFHFESQTLARLSHPNIAQIYEAGVWDDDGIEVPFFAMEYVPGAMTLVDYANKRQFDLRDRLELFGKICDAVHHGHQKGVIHRDLKPDNILVDNKGEPKIIDFGVARATDADLALTTMQTTMGQIIGTLQYMSPEQCDADPDRIDTRSDVYALGVILFQLLSGHLPYDLKRLAIHEAVRIIKDERPLAMSTVNLTLKGDIETVVTKAMEKDRERRYQSAAEFASDIVHFLNNEPIIARPLSISYQLKLLTKKYKRTCVAVILCAISIILGLVGTSWGMVEANRQKMIADYQRELVEDRNEVLQSTVESLMDGVKDVVQDLGNSADAQRALLDLARENLDALQDGAPASDLSQLELAALLMRNARSHLSISGVGYGSTEDAQDALQQAETVLDSIDLNQATPNIVQGVKRMELDRQKYLAELEKTRADLQTNFELKQSHLQDSAGIYKTRHDSGETYYKETADWKGLEVQWSSLIGLGNTYLAMGSLNQSHGTFQSALPYIEELLELVPTKSSRWNRGIAITCYSIARVSEPDDAIPLLNRAIRISREILAEQSTNARRPRDLASMLGLRGMLVLSTNQESAMQDLIESTDLFTLRAIESPQELTTQQDFEDNLMKFSKELVRAGYSKDVFSICNPALVQLECIASTESIAGRQTWKEIINRLRVHIDQTAQVVGPEQ